MSVLFQFYGTSLSGVAEKFCISVHMSSQMRRNVHVKYIECLGLKTQKLDLIFKKSHTHCQTLQVLKAAVSLDTLLISKDFQIHELDLFWIRIKIQSE